MKRIAFAGLALTLAGLFGMVQFGSPAAFARPDTNTQSKNTQPRYRIRKLPGLTTPVHRAQNKARKKAEKVAKAAVQQQAFLGTIAKKNGHYVLTAGIFTFKLNDQAQAKKFNGKKVRVSGKLNPQTNRIQVASIKKVSA